MEQQQTHRDPTEKEQETALTTTIQQEVTAHNGILNREQVYEIMDRIDEIAMMKGIGQSVLESCVYKFKDSKGNEVVGLSKTGVDTAVKQLANMGEVIREEDVTFQESGDAYFFIARATRYAIDKSGHETKLETSTGFKRQPKKQLQKVAMNNPQTGKPMYRNDGKPMTEKKEMDNPFAFEHGGIKAVRNAKRRLISESLIKKLIENKLSGGKFLEIKVNDLISETAETQAAQPKAQVVEVKPEEVSKQPAADNKKPAADTPPAQPKAPAAANNSAELKKIYAQFTKDFILEVILPKYKVPRFGEIPYEKIRVELPMLLEQQKSFVPGQTVAAAVDTGNKITSFVEKGVRYDCCGLSSGAIVNKVDLKSGEVVSSYNITEAEGKITCSCPATRICKHIHLYIQHNKEKESRIIPEVEWKKILEQAAPAAPTKSAPSAPPAGKDLPPNPEAPPAPFAPAKAEIKDRKYWDNEKTLRGTKETVVRYFNEVHGLRGTKLFNLIMAATGYKNFNDISSKAYDTLYLRMFLYTQKKIDETLGGK